jgi:ABC-type Na+ efflux pump permease subunit
VAVGAAVGGVIAIVAIVALAVIITRRRRDAAQAMSSDLNEFQNPTFDQR